MRPRVPLTMRAELGGLAFAGVILAHWLGYMLAAPDPHARLVLMHHTGHGYWGYVVALAVGAVVAGLAGRVVDKARSLRRPSTAPGARRLRSIALSLLSLQALIFLTMEAGERAAAGVSVLHLATEPAVLIGLVLQVLVAFAGALLLVGMERAVELVIGGRQPVSEPGAAEHPDWEATSIALPRLAPAAGERTLRGPPLRLAN